ncbi:hypothetical protein BOS5A_110613 [Bosea sp. EC-HK365B]|nr:hypothetical protein BOSE7B_41117 [Bosea sp. 7B]VVT52214.1 hypothetical protein BOS5A_110613 [Bosea sp. EC-HK365B]VXC89732.1 hypothetical protein BOSE127_70162 [Bosea sp. 127]
MALSGTYRWTLSCDVHRHAGPCLVGIVIC